MKSRKIFRYGALMTSYTVLWFSKDPFSPGDNRFAETTNTVPWSSSKLFIWDATCNCPHQTSLSAVTKKLVLWMLSAYIQRNYSHLDSTYKFVPVAVETGGAFDPEALSFFKDLGC